jgi:hypothetical protein
MAGNGGSSIIIPDIYSDDQLFCELSALSGKNDSELTYRLAVATTDYTTDFEKEPNDTKETATKFAPPTMKGYLTYRDDKDWYLYETGPQQTRNVTVTGIEGAAFTVSITDQNGAVIRTEKISGKNPKSFKEIFDRRGYIVVESQKEITTEPYTITVGK